MTTAAGCPQLCPLSRARVRARHLSEIDRLAGLARNIRRKFNDLKEKPHSSARPCPTLFDVDQGAVGNAELL